MRYRIYMDNTRFYDVKEVPDFKSGALVRVGSIGKLGRTVYINKDHVVCIEEVPAKFVDDKALAWKEKNVQYEKEMSKKSFKDTINIGKKK